MNRKRGRVLVLNCNGDCFVVLLCCWPRSLKHNKGTLCWTCDVSWLVFWFVMMLAVLVCVGCFWVVFSFGSTRCSTSSLCFDNESRVWFLFFFNSSIMIGSIHNQSQWACQMYTLACWRKNNMHDSNNEVFTWTNIISQIFVDVDLITWWYDHHRNDRWN